MGARDSSGITRREFLAGVAAVSGAAAVGGLPGCGSARRPPDVLPPASAWEALRARVGGRLIQVRSPLAACTSDASGNAACADVLRDMENPFYVQSQPGGQQTNGWLGGWTAEISPYAVEAESPDDVAAAIDFARENGVRLVVKGAGHDYKGRSNAGDSLLVWTHRMRDVTFHEEFTPHGSPAGTTPVAALSAAAGARWFDAYSLATARSRYVQGGGCTSVGVAGGFIQGGGYGSFSKRFGTGAGGVLEFEVVTADGKRRIANRWQHSDLFWALRGGGGGTFGIVTRVTLLAHEMPKTIGLARGKIQASSDQAFRDLIARFVEFYPGALNNAAWGEQIAVTKDNALDVYMTYLDLDSDQARHVWAPLIEDFAGPRSDIEASVTFDTYPFEGLWNAAFWDRTDPKMITRDERPEAPPGAFWWTTNQGEVSEFIYTYQSRWIPIGLFEPSRRASLVNALYDASRHATVRLQVNKGLSGTPPEAAARDRSTSIHPGAFDAAMIVILADRMQGSFPGVPGREPDLDAGRAAGERATNAMKHIRAVTPGAGTYGNESDFFEVNWKEEYYGPPYAKLLEVKKKYDSGNLFRVHQGVGSDL